ncbi:MAG: hypothetical protein LKF42_00525 [Streptococcaceae bacterium]|jgi:hypothetical protein|nr:hypothetical protein [Streptococcaceae bacterium]MCH4176217.1 hypothetical protein [Streptococcaceae bacterium]
MTIQNNDNEFLDWGGSFIAEESQFTLLPDGEYPFTVTNLERKIYDGNSDKIPNGAPYAEVSLEVVGTEGKTTVFERLYMMKKWQWKLTQFFTSIGQAPVIGQAFSPNWSVVIGSQGRVKVETNTYTVQGQQRQNNRVKEFLKPAANSGVFQQQPTQNFQQPQQNTTPFPTGNTQPQQNGFGNGAF